jgi:hypothetical protein
MTIKYLAKCGEVCQMKIGYGLLVFLGVMSFTTIFLVLLSL